MFLTRLNLLMFKNSEKRKSQMIFPLNVIVLILEEADRKETSML